jgi:hypothetical protein
MGYIVVVGEGVNGRHFLQNYTINGEFIRRVNMESETINMCCFQSKGCYDCIAVVNSENEIVVYDAFHLREVKRLCPLNSDVCTPRTTLTRIEYNKAMASLVVGTNDGSILILSYDYY